LSRDVGVIKRMKKILLAEDDPTMVSLLKMLLGLEGYLAVNITAENQDIIQLTREEHPDLILMDVHLGDQNGLEVVRELRKCKDVSGIKVIMTSGMNLKDDCQKAGADDFVMKPFMPDELLKKIRDSISE
jgi:DNA-binding response OmpR family regulator